MAKVIRFVLLILLLLLTSCGPQATPFPADNPIKTSSAVEAGDLVSIHYALAVNTQGLVADLGLIQVSAQVEQLTEPINPDDLGTRYDLVAAYGDFPDSTRSPIEAHVALIFMDDNFPVNNPVVQNTLKHSVNPQAILDRLNISGASPELLESVDAKILHSDLANSGWPDGFSLNMAYSYTPGFEVLVEQFQNSGIRIQSQLMQKSDIIAALDNNRVQIALINWVTPDERMQWSGHFGEDNVVDLYTIPISYRAISGLNITFTPDGWPLANR